MENKRIPRTEEVLGLPLCAENERTLLRYLSQRMRSGTRTLVFTPNLEMLASAREDPTRRALLLRADLLIPDGIGAVLLSGGRIGRRIPGIELGERLLAEAADHGYRVALLGGRPGVAARAARKLRKTHAGLRIVFTHDGYFGENELPRVTETLRRTSPELLFVCTGFPRQELLLTRVADGLPTLRLGICLGGSLDVWSGTVRRAPRPFRLIGLEWLWRTLRDPSRLPRLLGAVHALTRHKETEHV